MSVRILVAEDEKDLNRIITNTLKDEGYSVDSCYDGAEALEYLSCAGYDAAVLDIMMPKMDGYEVVKSMRAKNDPTPVLFLTARDTVDDRVAGLDIGADDYLVKPFAFSELLARIRAVTRKYSDHKTAVYTAGDLSVDTSKHGVTRAGRNISLSSKEYAILEFMIKNKGVVLSREKIENNAWNYDYEGGSNVVDVYISYLRKKIDDGFDSRLIHTVWGSGWTLRDK